ncbi:MAG: hypothetical protein EXR50_03490 [Dehalococcoidia bacterium]|nr:hypothetical protein [Dehalococcoidia bacterium]
MVKDTGAQAGADRIKSLNQPIRVSIGVDNLGTPTSVILEQRPIAAAVADAWRIDDEWWRPVPISRCYYSLIVGDGRKLTVFHDLLSGLWYRQNYD